MAFRDTGKDTVNGIEKAFLVSEGKLHILIQIREGFIQNKMLNAGMDIGFDVEGKEKVQQTIQFPMSRLAEMFASGSPMGDMESMRLMALLQAKNFNLKNLLMATDNIPLVRIMMPVYKLACRSMKKVF